jgi:hypothetical protein
LNYGLPDGTKALAVAKVASTIGEEVGYPAPIVLFEGTNSLAWFSRGGVILFYYAPYLIIYY